VFIIYNNNIIKIKKRTPCVTLKPRVLCFTENIKTTKGNGINNLCTIIIYIFSLKRIKKNKL